MKRLLLSFLIFLAHLLATQVVWAATTHNLIVSYYDSYDNTVPSKQNAIEENIRYLADAIYEMSNGAQKVGRVTVYTDYAFKDTADIIWEKDVGDDKNPCWFNAYISGRLREKGPYKRIQHCDIGANEPEFYNMLAKPQEGGYTLAHEMGHYFYGLYDEYAQGASPPASAGSPSASDTAVPNSIMNSQTQAVSGDMSWLNFSTALNNQGNNAQFRVYNASGWDTLIRPTSQDPSGAGRRPYYPELVAVAPAAGQAPSIELTGPEAQTVARSDLKIEWKRGSDASSTSMTRSNGSSSVGVVRQLVVDLSTQMSGKDLNNIKNALKQWVGNARIGDFIGIVGFADTATVLQPLTRIEGPATKQVIITMIEGMTALGSSTALGDALQTVLPQFKANHAPEDLVWSVYLLSSGTSNLGVDPLSLLQTYLDEDVTLHTFNFGQVVEGNVLQQLAESTEGEYWLVKNAKDLMSSLNNADKASSPIVDALIKVDMDIVTDSKDFSFHVDSGISEISVEVVYDGQLEQTVFTLVDPQGNNHTFAPTDCENMLEDEEEGEAPWEGIFCSIDITPAPTGSWTLKAVASLPETLVLYAVTGIPQENAKTFFASVDSVYGEELVSTQPMILVASVGKGFPITGLTIEGEIEQPDGTLQELVWQDDGVAPDTIAQDGLYTTQVNYTQVGDYYVMVGFDNHANTAQFTNYGVSYAANPNGNPPLKLTPVEENFERFADLQIMVTAASSNPLPVLEDSVKGFSLSIDKSGNFDKPNAKFSGGAAVADNSFTAMTTVTPQQPVTLKANIEVAPEDVGKVADILFVRGVESPPAPYDGSDALYYAQNAQGVLTPVDLYASVEVWMAQLTDPFQVGVTLPSTLPVDLWNGPLEGPAMYYFFVGYQLETGTIVYNARPIIVNVE